MIDKLYRYQDQLYSVTLDEFENYGTSQKVELHEYRIVKLTPKGAWITYGFGGKDKFINLSCRKKFACETVEEAKEQFILRKKAQIRILSCRLEYAKSALWKIENNFCS